MKPLVEKSKLFEVLFTMPKGSIHHLHTSAAPPIDVYIEMTRNDLVYYNEKDGLFKVFPIKENIIEGYL